MRILVCGGRDYADPDHLNATLDALHDVSFLIEGGARGADTLAHWWAVARGIPHRTFAADWDKHGFAAGSIRNSKMLEEGKPDLVVAFPGGKGTANMVAQAERAGIEVLMPGWPCKVQPTKWGSRP